MNNFIEIKNGYLRIPINISEKRLFSKDNFFSLVNKKNISKVGWNIIDINNKKFIETLKNINIKINEGDRIAIVGHNGAGKTTFLRLISGIFAPSSGTFLARRYATPLIDKSFIIDLDLTGYEVCTAHYLKSKGSNAFFKRIKGEDDTYQRFLKDVIDPIS